MRTRDGYLRILLSNHRHLAVSCIHAHALSVSHSLFTQDMNRAGPHFSAHRSSQPHPKPPCITSIGAAPCHSCHIAGPWGWRTAALRKHTELASHRKTKSDDQRYHKTKSPGSRAPAGPLPPLPHAHHRAHNRPSTGATPADDKKTQHPTGKEQKAVQPALPALTCIPRCAPSPAT